MLANAKARKRVQTHWFGVVLRDLGPGPETYWLYFVPDAPHRKVTKVRDSKDRKKGRISPALPLAVVKLLDGDMSNARGPIA